MNDSKNLSQVGGNIAPNLREILSLCSGFPTGTEFDGNITHCSSLAAANQTSQLLFDDFCAGQAALPLGSELGSNIVREAGLRSTFSSGLGLEVTSQDRDIHELTKDLEKLELGTSLKTNINHKPMNDDVEVTNFDIKAILKFLDGPNSIKPPGLYDTTGTIAKFKTAKAISDCADALAKILIFMVLRKRLFYWTGCVWVSPDEDELMLITRENLPDDPLIPNLSTSNFEEIYRKLMTDPRLQVDEDEIKSYPHLIPGKDGVIDTMTGKIHPSDPRYYHFAYSHFSVYDVGRGQGQYFELFIRNCTDGDWRMRQRILEMIGVILSGYMIKRYWLLVGPMNTGKSQLLDFLKALVGDQNCESISSLNEFSGEWTTGKLLEKKLCVCPDVPKEIVKTHAMSIIRQLSGGDLISANRKYHDPFTYIPACKLVFAANDPIQIENAADEEAFIERCVTIKFNNKVPREKMIQDLAKHLYAERGYIIAESITALRELRERNFIFTEVDTPLAFKNAANPDDIVVAFCERKCDFKADAETATSDLHAAIVDFCMESDLPPIKIEVFARTLSKLYPNLERIRNVNGINDRRGFKGITL